MVTRYRRLRPHRCSIVALAFSVVVTVALLGVFA